MGVSIGLNSAMRALLAHQAAIDVAAHNVANVATPGYSRQRIRLQATSGAQGGGPVIANGYGVEVLDVERIRDRYLDFQMRTANEAGGRHEARATSLASLEVALGEPTEAGLRTAMSRLWNSWRDLASSPNSTAARATVIESAATFATTSQRVRSSIVQLQADADARLVGAASEINALSTEIAGLNQQIAELATTGGGGDLQDRRDIALDKLSTLVDARYTYRDDGRIDVSVGGRSLVRSATAFAIYGDPNVLNANFVDLKFVADDAALTVSDGQVAGLLEQRDSFLSARVTELDAVIGEMITDVNTLHAAGRGLDGSTGNAFFAGTDASNIAVAAGIRADRATLAAATNWDLANGTPPGDGTNAAAISDLQYAMQAALGNGTYDEYYEGLIGTVGAASRAAQQLSIGQTILIQQLGQARQGVSGVNLDEEMVGISSYQRAYQAAARVVSVIDEMLDHLINRMI